MVIDRCPRVIIVRSQTTVGVVGKRHLLSFRRIGADNSVGQVIGVASAERNFYTQR